DDKPFGSKVMSTSAQTRVGQCGEFRLGNRRRAWMEAPLSNPSPGRAAGALLEHCDPRIMDPADSQGMPDDVLIVEDDAIIALDFEDTILGFGVKTVRSAASVAKALEMIADRAPDFALL